MQIIPAIDIMEGKCVRLTKGNFSLKKVYSKDPVSVALKFKRAGASIIHVVDLDGALTGKPKNLELIVKLKNAVQLPIQIGGGIRDFNSAKKYLSAGVDKIIIGSKALERPSFLKKLVSAFGEKRIIISLDFKNNKIAKNGWQETLNGDLAEYISKIKQTGVETVIVTDANRDGTLTSPNFALMKRIKDYGFNVIAAGGVSSQSDLEKLKVLEIQRVIIGKALYERKIPLNIFNKFEEKSDLAKRIIPCLDVKNGKVVKGINFKKMRYAGDPVSLAKKYCKEGADELVFLDINASKENRKTMINVVKKVAKEIFIPFTVGGGINGIEDIRNLLKAGADKVSLNTNAVLRPSLVSQAARLFGSQCIVAAIDIKKNNRNIYKVFIKGGSVETKYEALEWAKKVERLGAGEILLTSMDADGKKTGFDIEILKKISQCVKIPVIASGGAGCLNDFKEAIIDGKADAVLAASLFHFKQLSIHEVKAHLNSYSIPVRL